MVRQNHVGRVMLEFMKKIRLRFHPFGTKIQPSLAQFMVDADHIGGHILKNQYANIFAHKLTLFQE
jgi:hypothetical protein